MNAPQVISPNHSADRLFIVLEMRLGESFMGLSGRDQCCSFLNLLSRYYKHNDLIRDKLTWNQVFRTEFTRWFFSRLEQIQVAKGFGEKGFTQYARRKSLGGFLKRVIYGHFWQTNCQQ